MEECSFSLRLSCALLLSDRESRTGRQRQRDSSTKGQRPPVYVVMCFNAVPPDPLPGWGAWMEGRAYLTNRCDWNIIYLTRQPVREVKASRPGD